MKEIKPTNETGKNPETEQEKEVLPSFFQTLKTSTSKPLPNREVLEYTIMHSAPVKTNTEGYRSMIKVDKRTAEDIKHRLPCITPSVQLKGNSKKLTDFQKETYWLMLDYDDVPPKNIAALRQTARKIPFTMVFYVTVSGKGFRILLRYMRPEGCNLTATELHQLAIRKAMS
ncbi:BT4734/BF3469 family protein, partial [Segatella copri]|uniref:BT4734/BF3469 family protein n=1 Tax=Segatella copri TaxID=165179 RepID=UPI002FF17EE4